MRAIMKADERTNVLPSKSH